MTIPWSPYRIPVTQPSQVHLSEGRDQWLGDSPRAAQKASRGGKTDTNIRPLLDGVGAMHAKTPRESGYHYLAVGRNRFGVERRRALSAAELDMPFEKIPKSKFVRLRRTRRRGLRYASRVRPLVFAEVIATHKKYGAIPVCEVKKFISKDRARSMYELACRRHQTVWFKVLVYQSAQAPTPPYSMRTAAEKAEPFHQVGAPIALATHGFPPPHDIDGYRHLFDAIWGSNAERYRR